MPKTLQRRPLHGKLHAIGLFLFVFVVSVSFFATMAKGEISEFAFDPSGNLLAEFTESPAFPQIIGQPQTQIVIPGQSTSFSVVVADASGVTYQWMFNGTSISEATADSLLLTNVNGGDEGSYSVIVSNPSGSVPSSAASLYIDANGNGLPDSWEIAHFGNLNQTALGDPDGDGVSNFQEFLDGTDPTNAASVLYRLTIFNDGGTVVITPNQPAYTKGQVVTLTATGGASTPFHAWTGDVATRSNSISLAMNTNFNLFAHFLPFTLRWTNTLSGDWSVASNWTPNLAPASNENVVIDIGSVVTLNSNVDLLNFSLGTTGSSPQLTGSGRLTISGTGIWNSGTMAGTGSTVVLPGANFSIANSNTLALNGRTFENMSSTVTYASAINMNGGIFTNDAGAVFQALNPISLNFAGGLPRFDNAGMFLTASNGTTALTVVIFNNYGVANILGGTFSMLGGGVQNGTVNVPTNATLVLGNGAFTGSPSITGAGQLTVSSGVATLGGTINVSGSNVFSGGSANFIGNYTCTNNTMLIAGAAVSFNGTGSIAPSIINLSGTGTLGGSQNVTAATAMNWTGGSMIDSGRTTIPSGSTLTINNPANFIGLTSRTLDNAGTVLWPAGLALSVNGGVITNEPGALFQVQGPQNLGYGGGVPRFDNAGTFRVTGGGCSVGVPVNNYSVVDIQGGVLTLNGGGSISGTITVPAGTGLTLGGNFSTTAGSSITGAGQFAVISGASTLAGAVNLGGSNVFSVGSANFTGNYTCTNNALVISGAIVSFNGTGNVTPSTINLSGTGSLGGSQNVTVTGAMNWTGGSMVDSGRTSIPAGVTLTINNPANFIGLTSRTLDNAGTILWPGGLALNVNGGVITNEPGALFQVQGPQNLGYGGGVPRFDNAGTFRVTGGGCFLGVPINNYNVVDIQGGVLTLNGGGTHSGTMTVPISTGVALGGSFSSTVASSMTGAGQLSIISGASTLAGAVNLAGSNIFASGTVNFTGNYTCAGNTMLISGAAASFNGTGSVTPAIINLTGGSLGGSQNVTATSAMNWIGGSMVGSGRTIIPSSATLTINNPANFISITTRTLDNAGTILWPGGLSLSDNGGVITNEPGALFQVQGTQSISSVGGVPRFDNAGVFRKSVNTGTFAFGGVPLNNYGTVDIQSGVLSCSSYAPASNCVLNCAIAGKMPATNYGQLQVSGAVTLGGTLSVNLTNNYIPATNDSFTVVTATTRNGVFSGFIYPSNKVAMVLTNTANSVIIRVTNVFTVPQPFLLPLQISGNTVDVTWTTVSNGIYRLEYNSVPGRSNWLPLTGDLTALSNTLSTTDSLAQSNRFYRVRATR